MSPASAALAMEQTRAFRDRSFFATAGLSPRSHRSARDVAAATWVRRKEASAAETCPRPRRARRAACEARPRAARRRTSTTRLLSSTRRGDAQKEPAIQIATPETSALTMLMTQTRSVGAQLRIVRGPVETRRDPERSAISTRPSERRFTRRRGPLSSEAATRRRRASQNATWCAAWLRRNSARARISSPSPITLPAGARDLEHGQRQQVPQRAQPRYRSPASRPTAAAHKPATEHETAL